MTRCEQGLYVQRAQTVPYGLFARRTCQVPLQNCGPSPFHLLLLPSHAEAPLQQTLFHHLAALLGCVAWNQTLTTCCRASEWGGPVLISSLQRCAVPSTWHAASTGAWRVKKGGRLGEVEKFAGLVYFWSGGLSDCLSCSLFYYYYYLRSRFLGWMAPRFTPEPGG